MVEYNHDDARLFLSSANQHAKEFARIWEVEAIANDVSISLSPSMSRSLGRTNVESKSIRLSFQLLDAPSELVREVVCHELAHIVDFVKLGSQGKAHGESWKQLVLKAGFEPSRSMSLDIAKKAQFQKSFTHLCLTCGIRRVARRKMTNWRCEACVEAGLSGQLHIEQRK